MANRHNDKARFGLNTAQASESAARFALTDGPPLPAVDFALVGRTAPGLPSTSSSALPQAAAVVITWADAEWAAMQQVFCGSGSAMPYSERTRGTWPGWQKFASDLPSGAPSGWDYWGYYRLVTLGGTSVLLFKSNTHLDYPGAAYLETLTQLLVEQVKPKLIMSIGTAGGAQPADHIGTVRAVSAGALYEPDEPQASWPVYANGWRGSSAILGNAQFSRMLFAVPTHSNDLESFCQEFNQLYKTSYTVAQLDPGGLNLGDATPQIDNQTGSAAALLTTPSFVVGATSGNYQNYAAIEMDDAIIGKALSASKTAFAFVRNISDPVQNAALPAAAQGRWGSAVYDACGFYTSFNGALTAWALLAS
jgi:nucleoside phosphorylase